MHEPAFDGTFDGWKRAAREALAAGWMPETVRWRDARDTQGELGLMAETTNSVSPSASTKPAAPSAFRVPRDFLELAAEVSCHRDAERWALLYRVLWRLTHGEPHLLDVAVEPDVSALRALAKAVHRDVHKMRAFVRFREVPTAEGSWYVAWFEPQHHIVEANASFFVDRFASMRWSILTPERCVHWDGREVRFTPGVTKEQAPAEDAAEELWRTYYSSIFNPARIKVGAMLAQMPKHYWKNLPEAEIIPGLLAEAPLRVDGMLEASEAGRDQPEVFEAARVPLTHDLELLRTAAATCRACPLWRKATCTVFGEGGARPRVVIVGEQPGDQEDRQGRPFVGPAGKLFNRALAAAGIERGELYVTNAVKHFKWEPQGKRRLHKTPSAREAAACRPWLEAELQATAPELIVCLGATAARSVVGVDVKVTSERGQKLPTEFGAPALITVHPSSLLRLPAGEDPEAAFAAFVADLRKIRE
ncbi:MAG TPA: UdgX family uracil-DNA binding protein [Opitutaceae bacterium]